MRRLILTLVIGCLIVYPASAMTTADVVQDKSVAPLSLTAVGTIAPVIQAIMLSGMDPAQKQMATQAIVDLAKYEVEVKAKTTESLASKVFDITVKVVSLAASIFAAIKVTT